jgi:hypothetical protein
MQLQGNSTVYHGTNVLNRRTPGSGTESGANLHNNRREQQDAVANGGWCGDWYLTRYRSGRDRRPIRALMVCA